MNRLKKKTLRDLRFPEDVKTGEVRNKTNGKFETAISN